MCQRRGARLVSRSVLIESGVRARRRLIGSPDHNAPFTRRPSVLLASATVRPDSPGTPSPRAASSSPIWLGLGHTLPAVSRAPAPSHITAILAPVFGSSRQPGVSKCPVSRLIAFGAPLRRQPLLRTPPELPWQGCALVPSRANQQRLHAHLTRRAVDSHSFAVLATDAHG